MADFDLLPTIGAVEIGVLISTFLFGVTTLQASMYYSHFPDDRWQLKTLVIILWLLELAHTIAVLHYIYTVTVLYHGQPEKIFTEPANEIGISHFLSGCTVCLVQVYLADRVRRFCDRPYLLILCWLLSFLQFIATAVSTIVTYGGSLVNAEWRWLVTVSWVIGATVDILIATLLCYDLVKERKSSFKRTTRLIDRILLMTIPTGLVTSLTALAVIICFETTLENLIWLAIYICLAKVYSNSMLATLNSRTGLRRFNENDHSLSLVTEDTTRGPTTSVVQPSATTINTMNATPRPSIVIDRVNIA